MRMNLKKIIYKKNIRMGRYHLVEQPLQVRRTNAIQKTILE